VGAKVALLQTFYLQNENHNVSVARTGSYYASQTLLGFDRMLGSVCDCILVWEDVPKSLAEQINVF
jgi:hypothetical protein